MSFSRESRFPKSKGRALVDGHNINEHLTKQRNHSQRHGRRRLSHSPAANKKTGVNKHRIEIVPKRISVVVDSHKLLEEDQGIPQSVTLHNPSHLHSINVSATTYRSDFVRVDGKRARFFRLEPLASITLDVQILSRAAIGEICKLREREKLPVVKETIHVHASYTRPYEAECDHISDDVVQIQVLDSAISSMAALQRSLKWSTSPDPAIRYGSGKNKIEMGNTASAVKSTSQPWANFYSVHNFITSKNDDSHFPLPPPSSVPLSEEEKLVPEPGSLHKHERKKVGISLATEKYGMNEDEMVRFSSSMKNDFHSPLPPPPSAPLVEEVKTSSNDKSPDGQVAVPRNGELDLVVDEYRKEVGKLVNRQEGQDSNECIEDFYDPLQNSDSSRRNSIHSDGYIRSWSETRAQRKERMKRGLSRRDVPPGFNQKQWVRRVEEDRQQLDISNKRSSVKLLAPSPPPGLPLPPGLPILANKKTPVVD